MTVPAQGRTAEAIPGQPSGGLRSPASVVGEFSPPRASPPACRATKLSRRPQGSGVGVDGGALRWPWGGGSGEAQLGLGSGGREGWGLGAETQVLEDPARDERVGEGGDAVAAAAARGAAQHVHREGPLEELGPALALCLGARVGFGVGFGVGFADALRVETPTSTES